MTEKSASLSFHLNFKSYEFANVDLPVEIRKPNMGLVTRTLSSRTVNVEPGTYYVIARLPAGQEIISEVEVKANELKPVELKPDREDESPHEYHELQHFSAGLGVAARARSAAPALESLGEAALPGKIRVFSGNLLKGNVKEVTANRIKAPDYPDDQPQVEVYARDEPEIIQLFQWNKPPINMAVPGWVGGSTTMVLMRLPDGSSTINMHLQHRVADLLCNYEMQNQFDQVAITTNSSALDAESLLRSKMQDPIAAAVGAYSLLRIGALDRLHDWTENLKNWFKWLPDGLTVRGEHLARLGDHDKALECFLQLPERGLPIFSAGLLCALERLGFYIKLGAKEFDEASIASAVDLISRLHEFATYTDFGQPILTYTGANPFKPDNNPNTDFLPEDGLDVSSFLI